MARLKLIIISVLLLSTVVQADMPNRLDSLRMFVAEKLSIAETGTEVITVKIMTHEINMGILKVCQDLPAYELIDTLLYTATSDGSLYATNLDRILTVERHRGGLIIPMVFVPVDNVSEVIPGEEGAKDNPQTITTPAYYSSFSKRLFEYPKYINSVTDTLVVKYYARDEWLTVDGDTTSIKNKYIEAAINYALYNLWATRGQFTRALFYKSEYINYVNGSPTTKIETGEK